MTVEEMKLVLRRVKIKATPKQIAIFSEIANSLKPLEACQLHRIVSRRIAIDLATVYRTLTLFKEKGIVREVADKSGVIYYEIIDADNSVHPHFKCVKCDEYSCLRTLAPEESQYLTYLAKECIVSNIEITLSGVCEKCQEREE
jgi:Fe2+ or Zn2+ uptake regulation protein